MAAVPLLELSTSEKSARPFIEIDKKRYDLRRLGDMTVRESVQLEGHMEALETLNGIVAEDATAEQDEELSKRLTKICELILDAPAKVRDRLKPKQRLLVVAVFTRLLYLPGRIAEAKNRASSLGPMPVFRKGFRRGRKPFRNSSGSTAATQLPGGIRTR